MAKMAIKCFSFIKKMDVDAIKDIPHTAHEITIYINWIFEHKMRKIFIGFENLLEALKVRCLFLMVLGAREIKIRPAHFDDYFFVDEKWFLSLCQY
jgi:hypothetical protein